MKKTLLLGFCLLALTSYHIIAQTGGPGVIVVSVARISFDFKTVITREDDKSEVLSFPNGTSDQNLTAYSQWYQKLISKLYQEDYAIKSLLKISEFLC